MSTEFWVTGVLAIVLLVIGLIIRFVRQAWPVWEEKARSEIGATRWALLCSAARNLILAAEQMAAQAGLDTGEKKKAFVVARLVQQAATLGIPITPEQVDALVEGVLKEIKRETTGLVLQEINRTYG
jgi:hypothetical protein